jgi:hypothetical protein
LRKDAARIMNWLVRDRCTAVIGAQQVDGFGWLRRDGRHAEVLDPDGNSLSLAQAPAR